MDEDPEEEDEEHTAIGLISLVFARRGSKDECHCNLTTSLSSSLR